MATNRIYEIVVIVDVDTPDDEYARFRETLQQIITDQGGTVTKSEDMGRRPLAYTIGRATEGNYLLLEVEGTGREIAELERRMRVNDRVIRYITVRVDEDRRRAEKFKAKRARKATRRSGGGKGSSATRGEANPKASEEVYEG
ncbi:MAG: 30S ribosomal protein S6 [Pyrinomonadaceae bacterium]